MKRLFLSGLVSRLKPTSIICPFWLFEAPDLMSDTKTSLQKRNSNIVSSHSPILKFKGSFIHGLHKIKRLFHSSSVNPPFNRVYYLQEREGRGWRSEDVFSFTIVTMLHVVTFVERSQSRLTSYLIPILFYYTPLTYRFLTSKVVKGVTVDSFPQRSFVSPEVRT